MKCELCGEQAPDDGDGITRILNHLRLIHPDEYGDGLEKWPDGEIVVLDTTLEPDDFAGGAA